MEMRAGVQERAEDAFWARVQSQVTGYHLENPRSFSVSVVLQVTVLHVASSQAESLAQESTLIVFIFPSMKGLQAPYLITKSTNRMIQAPMTEGTYAFWVLII